MDLSSANPDHGHQELRQSVGHINVKALKPTGIQYVTISRYNKRRTSNYEVQFLLSGMTQVFQDRNYNLKKRLSEVLLNQQSHQRYRDALV